MLGEGGEAPAMSLPRYVDGERERVDDADDVDTDLGIDDDLDAAVDAEETSAYDGEDGDTVEGGLEMNIDAVESENGDDEDDVEELDLADPTEGDDEGERADWDIPGR